MPGTNLLRELEWVHSLVRRDLKVCQALAHEVTAGADAGYVQAQIQALQTKSPLWQLRVNCLYYCHFVHMHHGHEDAHLFPVLRRVDAALNPVVDKLEADHRKVSDLLDDVEAYANALVQTDSAAARARLVRALDTLATELLTHLDFEESAIGPTLLKMKGWHG
jgi:hypothetical protein